MKDDEVETSTMLAEDKLIIIIAVLYRYDHNTVVHNTLTQEHLRIS